MEDVDLPAAHFRKAVQALLTHRSQTVALSCFIVVSCKLQIHLQVAKCYEH